MSFTRFVYIIIRSDISETLLGAYFSLFIESADVYSSYIACCVSCNMLALACATFKLELVFKNSKLINLFEMFLSITILNLLATTIQELEHFDSDTNMLFTTMLSGLLNLFIYCSFGKLATESFGQMSNCLFESEWLKLPVKLQKCYIIIIANAQIPLFYHGFDIIVLNLETFASVSMICKGQNNEKMKFKRN